MQKFALPLLISILLFSCSQSTQKEEQITEDADAASQAQPPQEQLKEKLLAIYDAGLGEVRYFYNSIDLNNDGNQEFVVYVIGPLICGSGGCNTLVFSPTGSKLKQVGDISVTNPPIVAAQSRTNGWLDLMVQISGGGLQSATYARLKFDGITYPGNPTVKPAEQTKEFKKQKVLIESFDSFKEGQLLRKGNGNP